MDRYTARMNLHGTTQRERAKNRLIAHLNDRTQHSLSYKNILLNGVETQLVINSGTQPYYKEFQSLPSQEINIGDYVEWANSHWIVVTCDSDDEIYRDGKLNQCNYLLKWQNELGEIIERWSVIQSASKYNDGTDSNAVIALGSDQLSIIVPIDSETIKLKKSMSKKFFIDGNTEDPTTYELTGTGNVPDTYNGHGITSWIVKECAYTATEDDLKYGVCNYRVVDTDINPTPSDPENPNETTNSWNMKLKYSTLKIKPLDRNYTITAHLYNSDGVEVIDGIDYEWNVASNVGEYLTYIIDGNTLVISLSVDCEDFGELVSISCMSKYTGHSDEIQLEVMEVW